MDTSQGIKGRKRKNGPVQDFLDNDWMDSDIGRSPTRIAYHLNVSVSQVNGILRHRRDSLAKLADRVPMRMDEALIYTVDPYRMVVEFRNMRVIGKTFLMTEDQMINAIRKAQDMTRKAV